MKKLYSFIRVTDSGEYYFHPNLSKKECLKQIYDNFQDEAEAMEEEKAKHDNYESYKQWFDSNVSYDLPFAVAETAYLGRSTFVGTIYEQKDNKLEEIGIAALLDDFCKYVWE